MRTTAVLTQEPLDRVKAEQQQTEGAGPWLCICPQAGFHLTPPLAAKRIRHQGQSQLPAGLLLFRLPGLPAAGCPERK
jgi:hypothetical protein